MQIDLDNYKLIIETINNPREILIDLKNELEEAIEDKEDLMSDCKTTKDEIELENLELKLDNVVSLQKINEGKND